MTRDAGRRSPITAAQVLDFWFGTKEDDAEIANAQASLWWSKNPKVDAEVRARFETAVAAAASERLVGWDQAPPGELARIILLDQFPRNIYRDTPQAFAYDSLALARAQEGLARGSDRHLRPVQRVFFYLPLEHAEDLAHQERSVALFERLIKTVRKDQRETFAGFLDYAVRHREIIERFGRFPHRNAVLGRESTPEEQAFLAQPGSSF